MFLKYILCSFLAKRHYGLRLYNFSLQGFTKRVIVFVLNLAAFID